MASLAYSESINNYDSDYDRADNLSLAREAAREQIIAELRDVGVVRLSNSNVLELEDALRERIVFTSEELDRFNDCRKQQ